jgi:hypothetical protein
MRFTIFALCSFFFDRRLSRSLIRSNNPFVFFGYFNDIFFFHMKEETTHALMDELEWPLEDKKLTPKERDRGVDELLELVAAVDGQVFLNLKVIRFTQGDPRAILHRFASGQAVLVTESFSLRHQVKAGDRIRLNTPQGEKEFVISGVFYDYSSDWGMVVLEKKLQELFATGAFQATACEACAEARGYKKEDTMEGWHRHSMDWYLASCFGADRVLHMGGD